MPPQGKNNCEVTTMSKRSMAITHPDKIKIIEDKNPENKDPQSVQTNAYNESAVKYKSDKK